MAQHQAILPDIAAAEPQTNSWLDLPGANIAELLEGPLRAAEASIFAAFSAAGMDGIRPAHARVFSVIAHDGSRVTDMAAAAGLTKQSMQYLVDDLEAAGYVERVADTGDRRAKLIRLTAHGHAAVAVARAAIAVTEERWAAALGQGKAWMLRSLLEELAAAVADAGSAPVTNDGT